MITTHSTPVRLRCRAVRQWAAMTDSEPRQHLEQCAACRQYFAASAELERGLRRAAGQTRAVAPATLEHDVLRALAFDRAGTSAETRGTEKRGLPRWVMAGAAMGAAAALAVVIARREPSAAQTGVAGIAPEDVAVLVDSAAQWNERWWNSVVPSTGTAIQNNALQQEVASVYAAAESALDFLALNFLPVAASQGEDGGAAPPRDRTRSI